MISVAEALDRILADIKPQPTEQISLRQGLGRVLSEPLVARRTQPPSAMSAMDGYATLFDDVTSPPVKLEIVAEIPAGASYEAELRPGQAARIFTGAPVPTRADSIVIQEDTEREGATVTVKEAPEKGRYIRPAGLDFSEGEILIEAGKRLNARDIGLAAAMNIPWLMVHRKPRISILATGDEVVMPGDPVGPNQIVSSNGLALASLVEAMGGEAVLLGIAADNRNALSELVEGVKGTDMLVTTGGASVGEHDLVQSVLGEQGLNIDFWRIAMRPGKPLMFGEIKGTPMLGLPGNPVSTLVCACLFLVPALRHMQGETAVNAESFVAQLTAPLPENDRRQDYLRATLATKEDGTRLVTPFPRQDSSMLRLLQQSDCFILRAPHAPAAKAGEAVTCIPLPSGMLRV